MEDVATLPSLWTDWTQQSSTTAVVGWKHSTVFEQLDGVFPIMDKVGVPVRFVIVPAAGCKW